MKLSDYIVDFLIKKGVTDCFTVVGGGAMHLNNSFGHTDGMHCTHFHHEQGAAIAAESYSRYGEKVAALCVTSGPGGTNAITGVLGGWLDSLPMFVVSGQVRYDTTVRYMEGNTEYGLSKRGCGVDFQENSDSERPIASREFINDSGLPRSIGDQEYDITQMTKHMCKYAVMLEAPEDIRYVMEKAWHLMSTGRPGPVWVDVPVNYQAKEINPAELRSFDEEYRQEHSCLCPDVEKDNGAASEPMNHNELLAASQMILDEIKKAKRPVIYAGGGIRISKGFDAFREMVGKLGVPVCTYWNSIDLIEDENPLYCGRGGYMGDRAGNFAVQNSDLLLVIGSRISIRQTGYTWSSWARAAKVIMVDIDPAEMEKHTIHVDKKICADARLFMEAMNETLDEIKEWKNSKNDDQSYFAPCDDWRAQCIKWKEKYPVVSENQRATGDAPVNVYGFIRALSDKAHEGSLTAVSNGACCVAGSQSWRIKNGSRFIINNAVASMGYGLPAAIGLCIASGKKETICLEGDGSIMMNLQELQTIVTNKLPIKLFLINNDGYHSIRLTQNYHFSDYSKFGIGPESGDLAFPEFGKLAEVFGYNYVSIAKGSELESGIDKALESDTPVFCEVFTDTVQPWAPKSSVKKEADGSLTSAPLEDLAPFLPREELKENMYI